MKILSLWINCHQFLPSVFPRRSNGADNSGQNCLFLQMLPLPFFSLSPRIAAAATFLCFNNPALTQLYITLCHSLTLVVHHCVSVQSCQLTSSNHQPVPAKTGTAAHSGGEEGLVEGWVVGISILLAGGFFAGKQSGI